MQLVKQPVSCGVQTRTFRPARGSVKAFAQVSTVERTAAPVAAAETTANDEGVADIYIGFEKGAPREGKGRVIKDNPAKYPGKDNLGPFLGATGGWAGGEAGLWQLREQVLREKAAVKAAAAQPATPVSRPASPPAPKDGKKPIYVGYSKDELDARKAGVPGRFILDDPAKYPGKDDIGIFAGATGGFAGGEKGLKQYVETGDVQLRDPNQPIPKQSSPVAIAGLLVAAGAGGGVLLNALTDLGENAVKTEIVNAPIDDKTKALLLAAVVLLGGVGILASGRALINSLQSKISSAGDQATKLVVAGAFWLAVFVAARFVLEL